MIRTRTVAELDPWIEAASDSLVASFARGVMKDINAVRAAISGPWSNGQTEGQVNKLKVVKRQMYEARRRPTRRNPRSSHSVDEPQTHRQRTYGLPDVLDRVELGTFRRQGEDGDIGGNDQSCRQVPPSLIDEQDGRLRDELLNETLFTTLAQARAVLAKWRQDYNTVRPHSKLGGLTPAEIALSIPSTKVHKSQGLYF